MAVAMAANGKRFIATPKPVVATVAASVVTVSPTKAASRTAVEAAADVCWVVNNPICARNG